jgi:hypothetical protein
VIDKQGRKFFSKKRDSAMAVAICGAHEILIIADFTAKWIPDRSCFRGPIAISAHKPRSTSASACSQQLRFSLPRLPGTDIKTTPEIRMAAQKKTDRRETVCRR